MVEGYPQDTSKPSCPRLYGHFRHWSANVTPSDFLGHEVERPVLSKSTFLGVCLAFISLLYGPPLGPHLFESQWLGWDIGTGVVDVLGRMSLAPMLIPKPIECASTLATPDTGHWITILFHPMCVSLDFPRSRATCRHHRSRSRRSGIPCC